MAIIRRIAAVIAALGFVVAGGGAQAQTDYYKDKTIQLVVPSTTGGGYDIYGRLVARHYGNFIPGKPRIIVQNMPGASGIKAFNYLYSIAPKDGTVIGALYSGTPFQEAMGYEGIQYKSKEFSWIGALSQVANALVVLDTAGVRNIDEAKKKEVLMGALSTIGGNAAYPLLLNHTIGTKFKLVTGYQSGTEVNLAMERGEVHGRGSNPWTSWKSSKPDWVRDGKIVPLVQIGMKKEPDLQNVPLLVDLAETPEQSRMFEFVSLSINMERPFATTPGFDRQRLQILRDSFMQMAKDSAFLADAAKNELDVDPMTGDGVEKIVASIIDMPKDIVEKTKYAIGEK
jgi:tripartite-type tricarboxylate transporter receptor subunit TctC